MMKTGILITRSPRVRKRKRKRRPRRPLMNLFGQLTVIAVTSVMRKNYTRPKFDISRKDVRSVQPPPLFGGFMLVPVKADEEELFKGHSRMKANRALGVYNSEKGSDYEYVSSCGLTPTRSPDDSGGFGHHMNFWAKTKGTDDDPELFFSSASYDDTDDIHCCKLDSFDDEASGIKHCEHINARNALYGRHLEFSSK